MIGQDLHKGSRLAGLAGRPGQPGGIQGGVLILGNEQAVAWTRGHHQRIQIIDPLATDQHGERRLVRACVRCRNEDRAVTTILVGQKESIQTGRLRIAGIQLYGLDIRGQEDRLGNDQAVAAVLILEEKGILPHLAGIAGGPLKLGLVGWQQAGLCDAQAVASVLIVVKEGIRSHHLGITGRGAEMDGIRGRQMDGGNGDRFTPLLSHGYRIGADQQRIAGPSGRNKGIRTSHLEKEGCGLYTVATSIGRHEVDLNDGCQGIP